MFALAPLCSSKSVIEAIRIFIQHFDDHYDKLEMTNPLSSDQRDRFGTDGDGDNGDLYSPCEQK